MPKVEELTLQGYKSIKSLSLKLNDVNILIGANGWSYKLKSVAEKKSKQVFHQSLA